MQPTAFLRNNALDDGTFVIQTGRSGGQRSNGKPWKRRTEGTHPNLCLVKMNYSHSLLAEELNSHSIRSLHLVNNDRLPLGLPLKAPPAAL